MAEIKILSNNIYKMRQLQDTKIPSKMQKNILREYFGSLIGNRPRNNTWVKFRDDYNKEILVIKKEIKEPKEKAILIDDWATYVKKRVKIDGDFTLRIKSSKMKNVTRDIHFKNIYNFENFLTKVLDEVIQSSSESVTKFIDWEYKDEAIFNKSILKVIMDKGGCNLQQSGKEYQLNKIIVGEYNSFNAYNPITVNNNCGISCISNILGIELKACAIRKEFNIESGTEISVDKLKEIYNKYNKSSKFLAVIRRNFSSKLNFEICNYILHEVHSNGKGHFLVIKSIVKQEVEKNKKYKRTNLAFDFETRNIDKINSKVLIGHKGNNNYRYNMIDTICSIEYKTLARQNKPSINITDTFTTTSIENRSSRQFLDFLDAEHRANRHYICLAHNGSRFDFIFLQMCMTDDEKLHSEFQYRGLSIISMKFNGHIFRDPCCFMPNSLETLCNNFKVDIKKLTDFELNGTKITNKNLCFYKHNLNIWDFLNLQKTEPEFWKLYVNYCEYDCKSLLSLWEKFVFETETLIKRIGSYTDKDGKYNDGSYLLKTCSVISKTTIGGLAKKIIDTLNKKDTNGNRQHYEKFFYTNGVVDIKKYKYICKFKRGGVSQCNQPGKHTKSISSVDITSQYPTALYNMIIPAGKSEYTNTFDLTKYGYYTIKNLVFEDNTPSFKIICPTPLPGENLNWTTDWKLETETYIDSEMLKYMLKNGLNSFDVIEGLVSNKYINGKLLFGKYVMTLFDAKAEQDVYKDSSNQLYNNALREVIKLMLNSLTGKLVEDPSKYYKLQYTNKPKNPKDNIDGIGFDKITGKEEENINLWVSAGVMVYSYSKRLLSEYIKCLPTSYNDVIHIETDGIYFASKHLEDFKTNLKNYSGEYPCVLGDSLGSVKVEHTGTTGDSYFLGKKFYYMYDKKDIIRIKGIRQKTIDDAGNDITLVNKDLYEQVYNWCPGDVPIKKSYSTLVKSVFGNINMSSATLSRTITPQMKYKLF